MAGIPLPSCDVGINARWKSCAFVWAKDGALVVAATATAFNGVADEYRLMVGRFDGGDPAVAPEVQTLVDTGVSYVSLDARPDGTLDLFYFVDRNQILYRSSRDSGLTWSVAVGLPIGSPSGTIEAKDLNTQELHYQYLRHCYSPEHKLIFVYYRYVPGTITGVWDPVWGTPHPSNEIFMAGVPNESGGIDWSLPPAGAWNASFPGEGPIVALQPLPQGSLALHGAGVWLEGLKSDFTAKSLRYPATFGINYPAEPRGYPACGWWDMKANVLVGGFWIDPLHVPGGAGLSFLAYHLTDSNILTGGRLADPPGMLTYQPPGGTGASSASYLRANTDARFWLLRQAETTGDLGFLRLEKIGATVSGNWV
jgi:hypothetical protein